MDDRKWGAIAQVKCSLFTGLSSSLHTDKLSSTPKLNILENLGYGNTLPCGPKLRTCDT